MWIQSGWIKCLRLAFPEQSAQCLDLLPEECLDLLACLFSEVFLLRSLMSHVSCLLSHVSCLLSQTLIFENVNVN